MKSGYVTKMNPSPLFSFGNHSKNLPAQVVKYNSPTLTTIIESRPSNDSSPSSSEIPPKVPKTSPPSSEYHSDKPLNTTGNPSNLPDAVSSTFDTPPPSYSYPHYLQSVVRPCCSKSPLPVQIRSDFHPNLDQPDSYMTGLLPGPRRPHTKKFQSFLNSQIHQTLDLPEINPQPFQRTSVALEQQPNQSHPTSLELAVNIQTPETTQLFSQEEKKELPENSQTAQSSKMVNETQSINEPEIPQSTSEAPVNNFELSASLNSGYGDSSLIPLGASRLQHYRSYNISPNDINSNDSDSLDHRRYCTHCHLCTLVCECSSSDENGKIYVFSLTNLVTALKNGYIHFLNTVPANLILVWNDPTTVKLLKASGKL